MHHEKANAIQTQGLNPLVPGNFLCEFVDESSYRGALWE